MKDEKLYYMRTRGFCGNCVIWWRDGGHGYTCNLDEAWKLPLKKALAYCRPNEDFLYEVVALDGLSERHAAINLIDHPGITRR
jgi:hypothetical protein